LSRRVYSGFPLPLNSLPPGEGEILFDVFPALSGDGEILFNVVPSPLIGGKVGRQRGFSPAGGYGDRESFGSYPLSLDGRGLG
jgi:hypothetical protein